MSQALVLPEMRGTWNGPLLSFCGVRVSVEQARPRVDGHEVYAVLLEEFVGLVLAALAFRCVLPLPKMSGFLCNRAVTFRDVVSSCGVERGSELCVSLNPAQRLVGDGLNGTCFRFASGASGCTTGDPPLQLAASFCSRLMLKE